MPQPVCTAARRCACDFGALDHRALTRGHVGSAGTASAQSRIRCDARLLSSSRGDAHERGARAAEGASEHYSYETHWIATSPLASEMKWTLGRHFGPPIGMGALMDAQIRHCAEITVGALFGAMQLASSSLV